MKRILLFVLLGIFAGCQSEQDVSPASGSFIRYFGSENNHDAVLAIEADGGFTLLSNVEIQITATQIINKIRITRTDANGGLLWERTFPEFDTYATGMKGASIIHLPEQGYLIVGDRIKGNTTDLLLLRTDTEGNLQDSTTISGKMIFPNQANNASTSVSGRAVVKTTDSAGDYFVVLASIINSDEDMFVGRFSTSNLSQGWQRKYYGYGSNALVNKIYTTNTSNLLWSSSVSNYNQKDVRIVQAPQDSELPVIGDPIVSPEINETVNDICKSPSGWVLTGATNKKGDDDIYLLKVLNNGSVRYLRSNVAYNNLPGNLIDEDEYEVNDGITDPERNDRGNSVCVSENGDIFLLGTVETIENQQELFLMKFNGVTFKPYWRKTYGGGDRDEGASVRALTDGSLLVFGTTYFGRSRKLMLMKLTSKGTL